MVELTLPVPALSAMITSPALLNETLYFRLGADRAVDDHNVESHDTQRHGTRSNDELVISTFSWTGFLIPCTMLTLPQINN